MIHELREYVLQAGRWPAYKDLFEGVAMLVRGDEFGRLLGCWLTNERSGAVRFLHLWAYESIGARAELRAKLAAKPDWRAFLPKAALLIESQQVCILQPRAGYEDLASTAEATQLCRYTCHVGTAGVVANALLRQLEFGGAPHAVWSVELPDPNEVIALFDGDQGTRELQSEHLACVKSVDELSLRRVR